MGLLWQRMAEIYGHRWTSSYGDRWLTTWQKALAGVSADGLRIGVSRCVAGEHAWPPTAPEFVAMCKPRPEDLGIPGLEDAWREALDIACRRRRREDCSHPVVWHAYAEAGAIGRMPEDKGRKLFSYYYGKAVDMAMAGQPLREIPKPLPAPGEETRRASPEEREAARVAALEKINKMLGRSSHDDTP